MVPTVEQKNWAMDIMHKLFNMGFYEAITYHKDELYPKDKWYRLGLFDWENAHDEELKHLPITLSSGETKVCVLSKDCPDWVIKVGFVRTTSPGYVEEDTAKDFCALEAEYYAKACDNRIEEYFAATYKIGEIDGVEIFMQEYARTDDDMFSDLFSNYVSEDFEKDEDEDDDDYWSRVSAYVEDMDNEERIYAVLGPHSEDVVEFIIEHDINDLHSGNWGVTKDGRFVMVDYSGYFG